MEETGEKRVCVDIWMEIETDGWGFCGYHEGLITAYLARGKARYYDDNTKDRLSLNRIGRNVCYKVESNRRRRNGAY